LYPEFARHTEVGERFQREGCAAKFKDRRFHSVESGKHFHVIARARALVSSGSKPARRSAM
jgi:hypothetical protein